MNTKNQFETSKTLEFIKRVIDKYTYHIIIDRKIKLQQKQNF